MVMVGWLLIAVRTVRLAYVGQLAACVRSSQSRINKQLATRGSEVKRRNILHWDLGPNPRPRSSRGAAGWLDRREGKLHSE